ncbi:hypothetical protein SFUMM280S_00309 [Streptomyces fumanus]
MYTASEIEACLPIRSDMDLVWVRQHVRQAAALLGFGLVDQTKLVTAASELARNTLVHGGGEQLDVTPVTAGFGHGLRLTFSDTGPGIADLERARINVARDEAANAPPPADLPGAPAPC